MSERIYSPADDGNSLASAGRIARNVLWNGGSEVGPLLAALVAMPLLIHRLGTERFGVLALAWTVFGYFGLFDLGLGDALTKIASERLAQSRESEVPALFWTTFFAMTALGLIGAILLGAASPLLVHRVLKIPVPLQAETLRAFWLLALALPFVIGVSAPQSILAAYQRFDFISIVRSPMKMLSVLGPLAVLPFSNSVAAVIAVLFVGHVVSWIVLFLLAMRAVAKLGSEIRFRGELIPLLTGFGGWVTASNVVIIVMNSADRFLLAALVSVEAVSYYILPFRMLQKFRLIPSFVTHVLFPAFSYSLVDDRERSARLFDRSAKLVFLALFPVALIAAAFAREGLTLWIGADFARFSAPMVPWIALAALAEALGHLPATLVDAAHRPDLNAKLHAIEVPFYVLLAWMLIRARGVEGAAIAVAIRSLFGSACHLAIARQMLPEVTGEVRRFAWMGVAALGCLAVPAVSAGFAEKCALTALLIAIVFAAMWRSILAKDERAKIRNYLRSIRFAESA